VKQKTPKGQKQDHRPEAEFGLAVEVWTMWHASRILGRKSFSYTMVMDWLHNKLPHFYASAYVTEAVEEHVAQHFARRASTPWV
jgi:hypothetical protein